MESTFLNVPQMFAELSEKSDKLLRDNVKDPPQGKEWFGMIKEMALKIADGEFTSKESILSGEAQIQFSGSNIPSYVSLITGEAEKSFLPVSSNLPARKRDHLHGKKSENVSGRKTDLLNGKGSNSSNFKSSHPPSGTPSIAGKRNSLRVKSELDSANVIDCSTTRRTSTRGKENSGNLENGAVSSSSRNLRTPKNASIRGKEISYQVKNESDCITVENQPTLEMLPILDRTFVQTNSSNKLTTTSPKSMGTPLHLKIEKSPSRSSRDLSKITSLKQEMFQKKLNNLSSHSRKPHLVTRSSRFSMGQKKYSGLSESRQPSALGTSCSSKATVKKEMLQCKENLAAENLKKVQDARRMKIEEKKKQRDEKMERTKEKRMQLGKAKTLSNPKKTTETVTRSTRSQENSNERVTRSREPKAISASETTAKTSQANSEKKTSAQSKSKKPTVLLKNVSSKKTPALSKSKTSTSSSKSETPASPSKSSPPKKTPASSNGRGLTPPMKAQTIISLPDTTITISKETENNDSLKKTPTSSPVAKAILRLNEESISSSGQKLTKSPSPNSSKKLKLGMTESTPKAQSSIKKPDGYELTPDDSSFTNYDMSEIKSDDDDEEESTNQKPAPSWALGLRLRNTLIHQYYDPIDTDELFGNVLYAPDLEQMFNVKKEAYSKRTSSAIWQSPRAFR